MKVYYKKKKKEKIDFTSITILYSSKGPDFLLFLNYSFNIPARSIILFIALKP